MDDETKPQEVTEPTPAPLAEKPEESVGDMMKSATNKAIKWFVIVISALIYLTGIVYAEVHGLTMLQKGVAPDMRIWATLGMVAAGVTAVVLPVALKVWTIEAKQRIFTSFFYLLDFAFLIFNAVTDFSTQTGQTLAPWAQTYVTYILPASPIIVAGFWSIVWTLDPSVRKAVLMLSLRAAMEEKLALKVADAAKGAKVDGVINAAASQEVDRAMWELFGAHPASGYYVTNSESVKRAGFLERFFGMLSSGMQRGISMLTSSQSERHNSDEPKQ